MSARAFSAVSLLNTNPILMFPNGCSFNATDVFVGSGRVHSALVTLAVLPAAAAPQTPLSLTFYDCITAATNRIAQGGTTTQETYRLIAGAQTLNAYGEPWSAVLPAIPAEILGLKVVSNTLIQLTPEKPQVEVPIEHDFQAGIVAVLSDPIGLGVAGNFTTVINYTPWVSGGTRRRRAYRPGSTTKVAGPARTNIPL